MVDRLLEHGSDPFISDKQDNSVQTMVRGDPRMSELLRQHLGDKRCFGKVQKPDDRIKTENIVQAPPEGVCESEIIAKKYTSLAD